MYGNGKLIWGIIIGIIATVALFCITVCIGSGINGITFGEQICEWFGNNAPVVEEAVETVEPIASIMF